MYPTTKSPHSNLTNSNSGGTLILGRILSAKQQELLVEHMTRYHLTSINDKTLETMFGGKLK